LTEDIFRKPIDEEELSKSNCDEEDKILFWTAHLTNNWGFNPS